MVSKRHRREMFIEGYIIPVLSPSGAAQPPCHWCPRALMPLRWSLLSFQMDIYNHLAPNGAFAGVQTSTDELSQQAGRLSYPTGKGFTLVELLVTISVIAILATLLIPAVLKAKVRVQGTVCVNNLGQLQKCWMMYADDHNDFVPPNISANTNGAWRSTPDSWIGSSSALRDTNTDAIKNGLLFRYDYNRSVGLYLCPGDHSKVLLSNGKLGPRRTRSYSMNGNLGGRTNEVQRTVLSTKQIREPSQLFVFVDEDAESIDDAHFLVWPNPDNRWVNLPAGRHNQGGVLSFADGHVESWHWLAAKKFAPKESYWKRAAGPDLNDLRRLQKVILPVEKYQPQ